MVTIVAFALTHAVSMSLYAEKFDSSLDRGQPFEFTLGTGQVIGGWDKGLLDMCEGEKRKLQIPPQDGECRGKGARVEVETNAKDIMLITSTFLLFLRRIRRGWSRGQDPRRRDACL